MAFVPFFEGPFMGKSLIFRMYGNELVNIYGLVTFKVCDSKSIWQLVFEGILYRKGFKTIKHLGGGKNMAFFF